MRTALTVLVLLASIGIESYGQSADERIAQCLNEGNYFKLNEEYSLCKEDVQTPMLSVFSEALLNSAFNRPYEACVSIDSLITYYQGYT